MSQVVSANIKNFFTNNDKFSSKFVKILHFRSFFTRPVGGGAAGGSLRSSRQSGA